MAIREASTGPVHDASIGHRPPERIQRTAITATPTATTATAITATVIAGADRRVASPASDVARTVEHVAFRGADSRDLGVAAGQSAALPLG